MRYPFCLPNSTFPSHHTAFETHSCPNNSLILLANPSSSSFLLLASTSKRPSSPFLQPTTRHLGATHPGDSPSTHPTTRRTIPPNRSLSQHQTPSSSPSQQIPSPSPSPSPSPIQSLPSTLSSLSILLSGEEKANRASSARSTNTISCTEVKVRRMRSQKMWRRRAVVLPPTGPEGGEGEVKRDFWTQRRFTQLKPVGEGETRRQAFTKDFMASCWFWCCWCGK